MILGLTGCLRSPAFPSQGRGKEQLDQLRPPEAHLQSQRQDQLPLKYMDIKTKICAPTGSSEMRGDARQATNKKNKGNGKIHEFSTRQTLVFHSHLYSKVISYHSNQAQEFLSTKMNFQHDVANKKCCSQEKSSNLEASASNFHNEIFDSFIHGTCTQFPDTGTSAFQIVILLIILIIWQ